MNINSTIKKILSNKWVLNIVSIIALLNIIGYLILGNINIIAYFIVFAILVRYFSDNMILVLGVPLILSNLLALRKDLYEGMDNRDAVDKTTTATNPVVKKNVVNQKKGTVDLTTEDKAAVKAHNDKTDNNKVGKQGFEAGRNKKSYDIDYASTVEDAYDELNNILGSDGIQRLTSDTQNLMKQQLQLTDAMKSMAPLINQIQPMVKNLQGMMGQMGDGNSSLGGMMDLAKKLSGQS